MPVFRVDSADDGRLDVYRDLKTKRASQRQGKFIAEGRFLVERVIDGPCEADSLVLEDRMLSRWADRLPSDLPVYVVPRDVLASVAGFEFHRGVLACARRPANVTLTEWLDSRAARPSLLVICSRITDAVNLGSILRNCGAFGADAVVVTEDSSDPWDRRCLRLSMGAALSLPILRSEELAAEMAVLRHARFETWAAVTDERASPLTERARPARCAIVLGNEANGLDASIARACDRLVTIPHQSNVDSLNVAAASAIFLYELTRPAQKS